MELAEPKIRDLLLDDDEEFRRLAAQHRELDSRLEQLSGKQVPSEQDRLEQLEIKKRKLLLKDQMADRIRGYAQSRETVVTH